jgi:acyl carrier protein
MGESNDVKDRVKKVVGEVLGMQPDEIADNARFVEDLHAESIQSIELVAGFEAEFDIEMDEDEALEVKDVAGAAEFIAKHLQG